MLHSRRLLVGGIALFALALLSGLLPQAQTAHGAQPMTLTGVLTAIFGDPTPGSRAVDTERYFLTDDHATVHELSLDPALAAPYGGTPAILRRRVTVTGVLVATAATANGGADRLSVQSVQPAAAANAATGASAGAAAASMTGTKPWITLLCRFADATGVTPQPPSYFSGLMANAYPGMDYYWREASFGQLSISGSSVAGWFNLPSSQATYLPGGTADLNKVATDCTGVAAATVNFTAYYGINLIFNENLDGAAYGGSIYLPLSGVSKVWGMTWMPPWGWSMQSVMAHEMGHGLGLVHSSGPYAATYDSRWDPMSDANDCTTQTASYGCPAVHYIAYDKDVLGWIPAGQKYLAPAGTTRTITLNRLGTAPTGSDYEMAQIPLGTASQYYTVEARRFIGYDSGVPGEAVVMHKVNTTLSDRQAQVVDPDNNGNPNDAGAMWLPGKTYTDAANGITVAVTGATSTGYTVTISTSGGGGGTTATQLAYQTQPAGAVAGAAFTTQPVVRALDSTGTLVPSFTGPVTLQLKAGTGTGGAVLSGTTTLNAVGGVATFNGLALNLAGTGYVLTASATGLTAVDSTAFTVATSGGGGSGTPALTSPVPGTTLSGSSVTFSWSAGSNVLQYWLYVGTTGAGSSDKFSQSTALATQVTVVGLPTSSGTLYVRLWWQLASGWVFSDVTYTTGSSGGGVTTPGPTLQGSPANGATGVVLPVGFSWSAPAGAASTAQYTVSIRQGNSSGTALADLAATPNLNATAPASEGLAAGQTYVWSITACNDASHCSTSTGWTSFTVANAATATQLAYQTQPAGAVAGAAFTTQPVVRALDSTGTLVPSFTGPVTLQLKAGTGTGGAVLSGTTTLNAVGGVATFNGLALNLAGTGYVLTASATGLTAVDSTAFTVATSGGGSALGVLTSPTPGSTLAGASVSFSWSAGTAATGYWLYVGTSGAGSSDKFSQSVSGTTVAVTGLPTDGSTLYVRLWTDTSSGWNWNDYTYKAASSGGGGTTATQLAYQTQPAGAVAGAAFTTQPVVRALDSTGTLVPSFTGPVTLQLKAGTGTGGAVLSGTTTLNAVGGVATFNGLALNLAGTGYVLTASATGLTAVDSTAFTVATSGGGSALGVLTSPTPGSTLAGASVSFSWSAGTAATGYWLYVGTSGAGSSDKFSQSVSGTTVAVTGLPTDGSTLYVRLWTDTSSGWNWNDYTYKAASSGGGGGTSQLGQITSPVPGGTFAGVGVSFNWSAGTAALEYWLYVGRSAGGSDVFNADEQTNLTAAVNGLPSGHLPLYVRLWTRTASGWQFIDYTYTSA